MQECINVLGQELHVFFNNSDVCVKHMLWLNYQLRLLSCVLEHCFHIGAHQHFTSSLKTEMAVFSKMFVPIDKVMQCQNSEDYNVNLITENVKGYTKIVIALLPVWDIFWRIIVPVVEAV